MTDKKKITKAKIAAAKRKPASKKPSSGCAKNYEKRKDGNWYHLKTGELVTKAGTINLLENKKDFPKGVSGNPKGYPKGRKNRSTIIKEFLNLTLKRADGTNMPNPLNADQKAMTVEEAVIAALIKKALSGHILAIQEIQDTVYGKMKDKVEITDAPTIIRDDIPDGN